jgi:ABC-type transport system substrate-binding protein
MDQLWDDGISVADAAKRKGIYTELNNMIMDTATMLPVFYRPTPFVWTTDLNVPRNYSIFPQVYEWSWQ